MTIPICASCQKFNFQKSILNKEELKPKWLLQNDYVKNFIQKNKTFRVRSQKKSPSFDIILTSFPSHLHQYKDRFVLYWAAEKEK